MATVESDVNCSQVVAVLDCCLEETGSCYAIAGARSLQGWVGNLEGCINRKVSSPSWTAY